MDSSTIEECMKNEHNHTSNRYIKTLVTQQVRNSTVYVLFLLLRSYLFPYVDVIYQHL